MGEVRHELDLPKEFAGSGRKVHVHMEASANSYMQNNHHQHLQKEPVRRPQRRKLLPSLLTPSLTATMKMQWIIPLRG